MKKLILLVAALGVLATAAPASAHPWATARNCGTPDAPWCRATLPDNHAIWTAINVYNDYHPWGVNYAKITRRHSPSKVCVRVGYWPNVDLSYQYKVSGRWGDDPC
jgi:hypothetical protein